MRNADFAHWLDIAPKCNDLDGRSCQADMRVRAAVDSLPDSSYTPLIRAEVSLKRPDIIAVVVKNRALIVLFL